jgi:hypothetical protein
MSPIRGKKRDGFSFSVEVNDSLFLVMHVIHGCEYEAGK